MIETLSLYYLYIKVLHILSFIAWMAALLYLPRLFVYHCGAEKATSEVFKVMEYKLYKYIMTPAMISTWIFGLALAAIPGVTASFKGAFHLKLMLVFLLSGYHGWMGKLVKTFAQDLNTRPHTFYRYINEIPFVLAAIIVFLVVVKPF